MYRTNICNELNKSHIDSDVVLCGWVQSIRDKGFIIWIDLRDRYGVTQIVIDEERSTNELIQLGKTLTRESVIQVKGKVIEREAVNPKMNTGEIEILASEVTLLNSSKTPPFTIEDETDGGEELRMKYRYLDIRRNPVKENLIFRSKVNAEVRNYLNHNDFIEVETPYLIKSTPEGARDFVVPSRINPSEFYALPQSPQTYKQLLMVGGLDKYYQIVKCFRDEDLRSDRQPEFTQIDCEMSFVTQEDILNQFEGLLLHLLKKLKNISIDKIPRITYQEAMKKYGNDKPDLRYGMEFGELNEVAKNKGFKVFDEQELVVGIAVPGCAEFSRKKTDELTKWVQRPQIGAKGLVWVKYNANGEFKSSVDKFFSAEDLQQWAFITGAKPGDLILVLSGKEKQTRTQLSELRNEMAERLGLRNPSEFCPLWVIDFPLFDKDEETQHYHAMHHPFTSPKKEDIKWLEEQPEKVRANAYDLVLNGNEIGGGSIRIHDKKVQQKMFEILNFSEEDAHKQFGFLMDAFEYGAPPHGGIALGFDRLVAILNESEIIRDYIAFPKNNKGRDVMIDAPSMLSIDQLDELKIKLVN